MKRARRREMRVDLARRAMSCAMHGVSLGDNVCAIREAFLVGERVMQRRKTSW
jgi:hypothetical protein